MGSIKKYLASLFPKWINDKGKHAIFGTLIYLGVCVVFSSLTALIVVVIIAAFVEFYDYISKKGTSELLDFLATIMIPLILYLIF